MPLLDHFRPPLYPNRHWQSFHALWTAEITAFLNHGRLPPGCFAEAQVQIGTFIEVDVATFQEQEASLLSSETDNGGVAVLTEAPPTLLTIPAVFPDDIEVRVFEADGGLNLVGAIELVSPANKDREDTRLAFAAKCAAYLQAGVGLLVIDVVTSRHANLHDELMNLLHHDKALRFPGGAPLYTVAYHPMRTGPSGDRIEARCAPLETGRPLPQMALSLQRGPTVMINLESTYMETRSRSQL